jgi:voltage-gated potassium channel
MTPLALFGCNQLAMEVAHRLHAVGTDFVMVDNDAERVEQAQRAGFEARQLDYTDDDSLRAVGIGAGTGSVFCLLPEDSENVFLAISARALDPGLRIVAVCQNRQATGKLLAAGADKVVDPYEISGGRVFELIERPELVELLEQTVFGRQDLNVAEIVIPAASWLRGRSLAELRSHLPRQVLLLGVVGTERGKELIFSPRSKELTLDTRDVLVILGARRWIEAVRVMAAQERAPD